MIIAALSITLSLALLFFVRLRHQRQETAHWRRLAHTFQERFHKEQDRRLIYERALALPLSDPQRNNELWARAQQGDDLARLIVIEQMAQEINDHNQRSGHGDPISY